MATYTTKFKPGDRVMVTDRFGGGRFAGVVESMIIEVNSFSYLVRSSSGVLSAYGEDDLIADLSPDQKFSNGDRVLFKFEGRIVHDGGFGWVVVEDVKLNKSFTIPRHVVFPIT